MIATIFVLILASQNQPATSFPLIPKPTINRLSWTNPADPRRLKIQYSLDHQDGFSVTITPKSITIKSNNSFNKSMAKSYLARLTRSTVGRQQLPTGTVELHPKVAWRGVHLFVGPKALETHKKLWTNVLLPLGLNKVVLQCEQTEWECLPNLRGGINMKRADLQKLCDWYRSVGVEVIPLVQSFGHIKWLTNNNANFDLVLNPKVPFAVDPRIPKVKPLFTKLWREVISVTKAKTIHFGLDEVDFRGFPPDRSLLTKLWKIQIPMLANIAKQQKVNMMLWGDELIASGEGAAPHRAKSIQDAKERRAVIPKGSYICDWHYQKNPDPKLYLPSLTTFKKDGFHPIASAWFEPENIRGLNLAASKLGVGTLQTTWAGYEINEKVILANIKQFSAMVLAADYAWSARTELPSQLGYDPNEVFLRLYRGGISKQTHN